MLTALTIHLLHVENFFVAFLRVSQRAFWPKPFSMLTSFIFSYSENLFVVFYLSFSFVLGQGPSAGDRQTSYLLITSGDSVICDCDNGRLWQNNRKKSPHVHADSQSMHRLIAVANLYKIHGLAAKGCLVLEQYVRRQVEADAGRRMVQTTLTSVTAYAMGRQLSGLGQSPFL